MQFNILDYIILAVLILSALTGLRRGFFNVVGGLMGVLIGLGAAFVFNQALLEYLEKTFAVQTLFTSFLQSKLLLPTLNPALINVLGYDQRLADPAAFLATAILTAASFLLILILVSKLVQIICGLLDSLFGHGILAGINRSLGMALLLLKNLIIMAIVAGILLSPLELGQQLGSPQAATAARYMNDSFLLDPLLRLFAFLKAIL